MYHGNEPYIFISYAHLDNDIVIPLIEGLETNGFRLWYDNGIAPGSEWPEYIAEKILSCSVMLVLLSNNSLDSLNCKREINFAIEEKKDLLVIHLEMANMTPGMKLQLNSLQAVHKYKYPDNDSFLENLYNAKILQTCKHEDKKLTEETENIVFSVTNTDGAISKKDTLPETSYNDTLFEENSVSAEKTALLQKFSYLLQQRVKNMSKSAKTEIKSEPKKSTTGITRNHILKAVEFANKNKGDIYGNFEVGIKITEKQLDNAISRFAKTATISQTIAFLDTTLFTSGKNGFLVTKTALYSTYNPECAPLYFDQIHSVDLTDKTHIKIKFKDGTKKNFYFSIYATMVFNLLKKILKN